MLRFFTLSATALLCLPLARPQAAQPGVTTLKTSTRLVVLDVVVTDKKGNPVHNLKPSDFTVVENGHPQTLRHVDEHTPATETAPNPFPHLPPGTFTNFAVAPGGGALNLLLIDTINTSLEDQAFVHQEMIKYLRGPASGTRIAILGMGTQLHLLQGFTSDPDVLRAAVEGKQNDLRTSPLLNNQLSSRADPTDTSEADLLANMTDNAAGDYILANYNQFNAERGAFQLSVRIRVTLESLNNLARYLLGFPGRKNLIWFSGAFPLNVLPNGDLRYPFAAALNLAGEFKETSDLLAAAQVSVYPIDARGLQGAANAEGATAAADVHSLAAGLGGNGSQESLLDQRTGSQSTMLLMAEQTGGKAFINTNDLRHAVSEAITAGSNYYTLAYTPADRDWKGEYRKLEVKLAQQGLNLAYRRGFYADDPEAAEATPNARPVLSYDPMRAAMLFGSPAPSEIIFSATVRAVTGTPEPDLAAGVHAEGKASGPFMRYNVIFKADARAIAASSSPKGRHINVGFLTYIYDNKGKLITTAGTRVETDIPEQRFQSMLTDGLAYQQQISVPAKGTYFLRVGVNDHLSSRIGALEIPVSRIPTLPPAK